MGILYSGIHGGYQKRTGGLVGRRLGYKSVISAIPHKSLIPRSTGQLEQQIKVSLLSSFLRGFKPMINIGFAHHVKKQSPRNVALAHNYSIVFYDDYPDYQIDYSRLVCSRGKLQGLNSPLVTLGDEPDTIEFKWLPDLQNRLNRSTDYVCFAVYDAIRDITITAIKMAKRADLSYLMTLPSGYAGDELHCYIAVASASDKDTSNSTYLKFTNI
nr:DUF6266 family protein [Pedobacter panaciterrae]